VQALTLELQEPRRRDLDHADVEAKERLLEQLRWRLAAVAQRGATEELGNAARRPRRPRRSPHAPLGLQRFYVDSRLREPALSQLS
jgi:hypothetical protein